jgi:hypothetical protein
MAMLIPWPVDAAPTTVPSPDDAPAPAAMAPMYVAIGKELSLRLALVRRTLDDLKLDRPIRQRADQIVDAAAGELKYLLAEIQAGRMPATRRLSAVPGNLRTAREQLMEVIGTQQGQLLEEKLRSLRGEGRAEIGKLRQALDEVKTSANEKRSCDAILSDTDGAVEKLPDGDLQGDEYAKARQLMVEVFARTHDRLTKVLTAEEQMQLGPRLVELAATRPSPG